MDARRALPSVDSLLPALPDLPHDLAVEVARAAVDHARARVEEGSAVDPEAVVDDARRRAAELAARLLKPVVNATGVIIHTNLGRAPLSTGALDAATRVGQGYSNL